MRQLGVDCELIDEWPRSGIVIAHRDHLPTSWPVGPSTFVVCCLADRLQPHPQAQMHIVQNPFQRVRWSSQIYMPHWPQPGLLPRRPDRGSVVRNLVFFGEPQNLAEPLRQQPFLEWCSNQGFEFAVRARDAWADYRDVDVALAVRSFNTEWGAFDKPATKLFNAWLGCAIPLVGKEAAYAAEGRPGRDCLVVSDFEQLERGLIRLRDDADFSSKLREAGAARALTRNHDAIAWQWRQVLEQSIPLAAERWRCSGVWRRQFERQLIKVKAGLAWRGRLLSARRPDGYDWGSA